jgi:hypothetical protein
MIKSSNLDDLMPLLVSTYQRGRLVPFLGAGMSAPRLTLWKDFVKKLEDYAKLPAATGTPDARAQRACRMIQNRYGRHKFLDDLRNALATTCLEIPKNTLSLAQIRWPLVVSTNYDDLFFYACRCRRPLSGEEEPEEMRVEILGRSSKDCKLVVSSLTGPFDRQYIWHVQGFLGGQTTGANLEGDVPNLRSLQDQLVIGHDEYRRVTNRAPQFRRCFAEVFNTRSFLFLGSSLKEDYFLNLFGEVLDLCGPSAVPHFAFTEAGQVDPGFLADQMNIAVCEFPKGDFEKLPKWIDRLKDEIEKPKARSIGWSFAGPSSGDEPELEVRRDRAPASSFNGEVVAFVACRDSSGIPIPSGDFAYLQGEPPSRLTHHIFWYPDRRIYVATARCANDDDDSAVYAASSALLDAVANSDRGVTTVHLKLPATGGTVPPIYAFMEVVRTFAKWRRDRERNHKPRIRLVLHIESDVELMLTSGRVDIRELLSSELVRFWAVVIASKNQEPIRRSLQCCADKKLGEVLDELDIPLNTTEWFVSVCPSARKESPAATGRPIRDVSHLSLTEAGVVFGSVLILEYRENRGNGAQSPAT